MRQYPHGVRSARGFTLVELLVVISLVGVLLSLLLPSLASSKKAAQRIAGLANLRSLEFAHLSYVADHRGAFLGTVHGESWMNVMQDYDKGLLLRDPVDTSPHFEDEGGVPVNGVFRHTSYAINFWLSPDNPQGFDRIDLVPDAARLVHFVLKTFEGPNAVSDHVHPNLWWSPIANVAPGKAAAEIQTNAHGGPPGSWLSFTNYGFLDGHAESLRFEDLYTNPTHNNFDPNVAH